MTAIDDRPTLPERYTSAIGASDLKMEYDERRPVDILTAAGWARDGLGTQLYRLLQEWDRARGDLRLAKRSSRASDDYRATLRHQALAERQMQPLGPTLEGRYTAMELTEQVRAEAEALSSRALILSTLKTLPGTRIALGRFASVWATRTKFMQPDRMPDGSPGPVMQIAARALDGWLDPLCPYCDGRGFTGGYRVPQVLCARCSGARVRRLVLARDDKGVAFGRSLMCEMDRKVSYVTESIKRFLHSRGISDQPSQYVVCHAALADQRSRLMALNSSQAAED